jgi:two-component system, NtrC family, nitrogen regulation response regulator NtrX
MDGSIEPQKYRILIVDDFPEVLRFLEYFLTVRCGYAVTTACDGVSALASAVKGDIDLALIDCDMPVMSGMDVLDYFMGNAHLEHIPVLMMTGHFNRAAADLALARGAKEFLEKPFDLNRLADVIRRQVQAPRASTMADR